MGISRACASKWVNRWRRHGEAGLRDRPSTPHSNPSATPAWVIEKIETWRREHKWSAERITDELVDIEVTINRPHRDPAPDQPRTRPTPIHRPGRRQQPQTRQDHRPLARAHGAPGREEGRPDPRRWRKANPRPRQRPGQCSRPRQISRRKARVHLLALGRECSCPHRVRLACPLLASQVGAVAANELRPTVRDLHRALLLAYAVFFGLSVTMVPLLVGDRTYLAATGVTIALLATTGSAQVYGNDGTALWLNVMAPGTERTDVRGRQLAWLLLVPPLTTVLTAVGVAVSGADWVAPWAWSLLPAALGGGVGVIVLVSTFALVPMADPK